MIYEYFHNNIDEIIIFKLPNNIYNKNKLFYDLIIYYELKNIKILYKNNIISKNELKNLIYYGGYIQKILYIFQKFVF